MIDKFRAEDPLSLGAGVGQFSSLGTYLVRRNNAEVLRNNRQLRQGISFSCCKYIIIKASILI